MITIISGTNRPNSKTRQIANVYAVILEAAKVDYKLLSLEDIPLEVFGINMYDSENVSPKLKEIQEEYIFPAEKWILITPEYNGSFPGVFKLFIDAISMNEYPRNFKQKKVALVGVSAGKAGNLMGMSAICDFVNYLGMTVFPTKIPLSSISEILSDDGILNEESFIAVKNQISAFIQF